REPTIGPGRRRPRDGGAEVIRSIRFLGAALGTVIGRTLACSVEGGMFAGQQFSGAFLAAWAIAWLVRGFGLLPYLTVVPGVWLIRQVPQLSTAAFVTALVG